MAREKLDVSKVSVSIPNDLMEYLNDRFWSKTAGKRTYGALSDHIVRLLLEDKNRFESIQTLMKD